MRKRCLVAAVSAIAILGGLTNAAAQGTDIPPSESLPALAEVKALLIEGHQPEAEQKLQQIQQANPERPEPYVFFAQQVMARSPAAARPQFEQALLLDPDNVYAQAGLARIDAGAGQVPAAVSRLEAASVTHPQSVELKAALADIYMGKQSWADAEAALDALLALRDEPKSRLQRGDARYQQQKLPEALADYKAVAATEFGKDPQYAPLLETRISTVTQALPRPVLVDASNRWSYFTFVSTADGQAPDRASDTFNCRAGAYVFAAADISKQPDTLGTGLQLSTAPVRIVGQAGAFGSVTLTPNIMDPDGYQDVLTLRMDDPAMEAALKPRPEIRFCPAK